MLYKEDFTAIGFIRKSYGYTGQARVEIDEAYLNLLEKQDFIFLEIDGYKVPFYIESKSDDKFHLLKLEYINSPDDLLPHHQKPIYVLSRDIVVPEEIDINDEASLLLHMDIHDVEIGLIGTISKIEKYPHQTFAVVNVHDKPHLIPLHEDLIIEIDSEQRIIRMQLPEGIMEI